MQTSSFGSIEMQMLWLSIALGLVQLLLAVLFSVGARGIPWGMGPRDEAAPPIGKIAARTERAFRNLLETFPFFAAAVLLANALGKHSAMSALGAQLFFWARLVYVPAYVLGIPLVRTLIWIASFAGIAMVLRVVWPGM